MADTKLTALTETTSPATSDDVYVVTTPGGTPASKRCTIANLKTAMSVPSNATPFITTAAEGTLSAEVVIPGLAGSPDIAGAGGGGTSEEYDTATTGLTWDSAPTVVDSNTSVKSHLYVKDANAATKYGYKAWSPAGAFDARCKLSLGADQVGASYEFSLFVSDSSAPIANGLLLAFDNNGSNLNRVLAFTVASSSFTQRGSTYSIYMNFTYLRITRDGSNNISFWYSQDGLLWSLIATQAHTFTVAKLGFRIGSGNATAHYGIADWLRTDV